jgi:cellulose synthase/poly-beta-1,6-N-acetylglucosamine synthase-like glycosyltransferase
VSNRKATLAIVTYLRDGERFPTAFLPLIHRLMELYDVSIHVFVSANFHGNLTGEFPINIHLFSGTKYKRLHYLFQQISTEYVLSMDNDISPNLNQMVSMLSYAIQNNKNLAFGKISIRQTPTLIANFVFFMKQISHNFLRPLLFLFNLSASIPGQVMVLKTSFWGNKLVDDETFLDDLLLGVMMLKHQLNHSTHYNHAVLGFEIPNLTWSSLLRQRNRWAKGFLQTYHLTQKHYPHEIKYLWIHLLAYEVGWLFNWTFIFTLFWFSPLIALLVYLLEGLFLSFPKLTKFPIACFYLVIFPFFRVYWLYALIRHRIGGHSHD